MSILKYIKRHARVTIEYSIQDIVDFINPEKLYRLKNNRLSSFIWMRSSRIGLQSQFESMNVLLSKKKKKEFGLKTSQNTLIYNVKVVRKMFC